MKKVFITGGAGFIGCNAAAYFAKKGDQVKIFDNFSRKGTRSNAEWLKQIHPEIEIIEGDVRNSAEVEKAMVGADVVIHLAGQVAVTTSVVDPREDFEINALGSFNVLEAARKMEKMPIFLYSSTNKVYGGMEDVEVVERNGRYEYKDLKGVPESRGIDFHSPYGCSKGAADQYVHDYFRIYGLPTVVFRQSCIYGYRQFGVEDQGWVAWFAIAAIFEKPITIFGDGKQVRDLLFVEDLVRGYDMAIENIDKTKGQIYNMGGGPENTLSLLELLKQLEERLGKKIELSYTDWRPGDQPVFVCDTRKAKEEFGWEVKISPKEGVEKLISWILENEEIFGDFSGRLKSPAGIKNSNEQSKKEQEVF